MSGQDLPASGLKLPADLPSQASSAGESETGQAIELSVSEFAKLLAMDEWAGSQGVVETDSNVYEGHAALALDAVVLPAIDSALDLLTTSPDLFDIPALQLPAGGEDATAS
jgi:hypothetical protein